MPLILFWRPLSLGVLLMLGAGPRICDARTLVGEAEMLLDAALDELPALVEGTVASELASLLVVGMILFVEESFIA